MNKPLTQDRKDALVKERYTLYVEWDRPTCDYSQEAVNRRAYILPRLKRIADILNADERLELARAKRAEKKWRYIRLKPSYQVSSKHYIKVDGMFVPFEGVAGFKVERYNINFYRRVGAAKRLRPRITTRTKSKTEYGKMR